MSQNSSSTQSSSKAQLRNSNCQTMAVSSSFLSKLLFLFLVAYIVLSSSKVEAQVEETSLKLMQDALEWPLSMSFYDDLNDNEELDEEIDDEEESGHSRRSLFWKRMKYYISYGALSANRIPCPPRSGRSYYTQNCFKAHGPVHPYTRGCSRITRCRR